MTATIEFLGGGRMAEALLGGLLAAGRVRPGEVVVVEVVPARRHELEGRFPGVAVVDAPVPADGVVVATKPAQAPGVLAAAAEVGLRRVVSLAAGVRCATLEAQVGEGVPVVRAMPNTPALVGRGAAAVCAGKHADDDDVGWARGILGAVGTVETVPEEQMDAVTALSGSGPAYVFLLAEALTDAAVAVGLPEDVADRLTRQTLRGAATLLADSGEDPAALRAAVTSPGGTTAAAIESFEHDGFRGVVAAAVEAARARSVELG